MFLAAALPKEEINNYFTVFSIFDDDNDGRIKNSRIEDLIRAVGFSPSPEDVEDILHDLSTTDKDTFDYESFLVILARVGRASNPVLELITIFKSFDRNNSGRISKSFAKRILESLPSVRDREDVDRVIKSVPCDNYGNIDYMRLSEKMFGL